MLLKVHGPNSNKVSTISKLKSNLRDQKHIFSFFKKWDYLVKISLCWNGEFKFILMNTSHFIFFFKLKITWDSQETMLDL